MSARIQGRRVERIDPGGVLGEIAPVDHAALVDHAPRVASAVVAETDCTLLAVKRSALLQVLLKKPTFGTALLRSLADRLRSLMSHDRQSGAGGAQRRGERLERQQHAAIATAVPVHWRERGKLFPTRFTLWRRAALERFGKVRGDTLDLLGARARRAPPDRRRRGAAQQAPLHLVRERGDAAALEAHVHVDPVAAQGIFETRVRRGRLEPAAAARLLRERFDRLLVELFRAHCGFSAGSGAPRRARR